METTFDWLKIIRFHKDIVKHAHDSFYQLEDDEVSTHRFSIIDDYVLDSLEGPWIIPREFIKNQTFRSLLESNKEQDNLIIGLLSFSRWGKLNPILVKEVRVDIDEDVWNIYPEQVMWDISPNLINYLHRNEIAVTDSLDEQTNAILERAYTYSRTLNTDILDTLLKEFIVEFSFLKELFNSRLTRIIIFKPPDGVRIFDKNLMEDYNAIEKLIIDNPQNIGGLQLLDQINRDEGHYEEDLEVLPVIPLNNSQRNAVQGILKNKLITVVSGPPGCGKSQVVISSLINCWAHGKSVLFASQNNKAVDVVRERFSNINTIVPVAIRAGAKKQSTVQASLATIRQSCVGLSNTAKGSVQKAKIEYENLIIKRNEFQKFLDSKLPALVDEAYRAALHAHATSLGYLAQIESKKNVIESSLANLGLSNIRPEVVYDSVLLPLNNWLGQIKVQLMEIEAEESNKNALERKLQSYMSERNRALDFYGLELDTSENCTIILTEFIPEDFERWVDDFRADIRRKGYREALLPLRWEEQYELWVSESDCIAWQSKTSDWIDNIETTLVETAPAIKELAELELRFAMLKEELTSYHLDTKIDLPLEVIQDWHSAYAEIVTTPQSWLNHLPFSKYAQLKRKLANIETIIRKHLPLDLLSRIGELNEQGRMELGQVLTTIKKWVSFKEEYDNLIQIKHDIDSRFSLLRNSPVLYGKTIQLPTTWERNEWLDIIAEAKRLISISLKAGKAWKKKSLYEEAVQRISFFEGQLNKMISKSFILSNWLNYQYPDLNKHLRNLCDEPQLENLIAFEELLYSKQIDQFVTFWNNAYLAQKQINDINLQMESIPSYNDHVKKWWEERPRIVALDDNLAPVEFPDNQGYLYKMKDSFSSWHQEWELFEKAEKVKLADSARKEQEYALDKLQYALELLPSDGEESSLISLINSEEVRGIGNPWPQQKLEKALSTFSPNYVKGKIAAIDNKIQAHSIKVAEAYWKERVANKPDTLNYLNDYATQFTRGNISVANFTKLLEAVPIWVTTAQSTKGFPLSPGLFDVLIVDEASQCTLTNLIPLVYRAKTIVVIGDKEQLPAIPSIGEQTELALAKKYGLDDDDVLALGHCKNDVYETALRVLPGGITQVYNLDEHYRSLPHIIVFSNQYIYGKRLVLRREVASELWERADAIAGIYKIHVRGSVGRGPKNNSWINRMEIDECVNLIQGFKTSLQYEGYSFGVVTPFRAQQKVIEDMLANKNLLTNVTVGTAHTFQGDERDIMIFSPVVARNMPQSTINWVENPHNLINVAVTRARDALFVVGDYEVMRRQKGALGKLAKYIEDMEKVRRSSPAEVVLLTFMGMEGWTPLVHPYIGGIEVDFVLEHEGIKLVIEVDGSQHQEHLLEDASRDVMLRSRGYQVTRIPARDVLETPNVVIDQLKKAIDLN